MLLKINTHCRCYWGSLACPRAAIITKKLDLFHENSGRYGYRRIHALLIREGITVSEKMVRRIMAEEGLVVLNELPRSKLRGIEGCNLYI